MKKDFLSVEEIKEFGLGSVNVNDYWFVPGNEGVDTDLYGFDCSSEKLDSFVINAEVGKDITKFFKWLDNNEVYPSNYGYFGYEFDRDITEDEIFTIQVLMHTRGYESVEEYGAYICCIV